MLSLPKEKQLITITVSDKMSQGKSHLPLKITAWTSLSPQICSYKIKKISNYALQILIPVQLETD